MKELPLQRYRNTWTNFLVNPWRNTQKNPCGKLKGIFGRIPKQIQKVSGGVSKEILRKSMEESLFLKVVAEAKDATGGISKISNF